MDKFLLKFCLFLSLFFFIPANSFSQEQSDMFKQKKERKRLWRRWSKHKGEYNPYLHKKGKDKPSAKMARTSKREQRKQKKLFKKQLRAGKRKTSD